MALLKVFENDAGSDVSYWNIGAIQVDFRNGGMEVTLYGYVNEEKRRAGKNPAMAKKVTLVGGDFKPDMSRADIYAGVLSVSKEFSGATSC